MALWSILIPVAIGSALIPIEIALTVVVLRAPGGIRKALAWVGGMTAVRLAQLAIIGPIVDVAVDDGAPGTSIAEATILLIVGVLFLIIAARKATWRLAGPHGSVSLSVELAEDDATVAAVRIVPDTIESPVHLA